MKQRVFLYLLLIGLFTNLFGYVSNLINNSNIIDIGKQQEGANDITKISKIKVTVTPNMQEISPFIKSTARNIIDVKTCLTDKFGHENCPNDMVKCNAQQKTTNGYSTVHNRHIEVASIHYLPESPDDIIGNYKNLPYVSYNSLKTSEVNPSGVFNEGAYTYQEQNGKKRIFYFKFNKIDERAMLCLNNSEIYYSSPNGNLADGSKKCGYIYKKNDVWGYSGTYKFTPSNGDTIYWAALNYSGPHGGSVNIYSCPLNKPLNWNTMKCEPNKNEEYKCPNGFKLSADKTYCYNDYKYYTYSCPTDTNMYGQSWEGPKISTGGDCLGNCGSYGCSCNSATPPNKNCIRDNFICPVDKTKTCSLVPDNSPEQGTINYDNNYIYSLGESIKHTKTAETNMSCPINWTLNPKNGTCEKTPEYKCSLNGFVYDKELGKCIQNKVCDTNVRDPQTNKCLYKPSYNCPDDGYLYDAKLGKCTKSPYCDKGNFNILTNKCGENVNNTMCPKDFSFNKDRDRCEKPMGNIIKFTEHKGRMWVGKIGDNYLHGWCEMDSFKTKFKVINKNLVEDFVVDMAKFDDYIGVVLNDKYVYVGPYDGNTLYVSNGHVVYYQNGNSKKTGKCELSTSWKKYPNKEAKYALVNGTNNVNVKVEVSGGGEGYASFHFKFKGRNTIQCIDNAYCSIQYSNNCPSGYVYDNSNDICYIPKPNVNTDLSNLVYWVSPKCDNGAYDKTKKQCVYEPTCSGDDSSISFDKDNHVCTESPSIICEDKQSLINTNVPGYENACINNDVCPIGSKSTFDKESNKSVCEEKATPSCSDSSYDSKLNKCVMNAICPVGYIVKNGKCLKKYTYYTYFCKKGWEGPNNNGYDCKGNCGKWGCSCNSEISPANNCRKKENKKFTSKVIQKVPLIKHIVTGGLVPEEFENKKQYQCGKDCNFVVTKIQGKNNQLCFYKKDGQIGCFTVDGCRFKGIIDNHNNAITELQIGKPGDIKNFSHFISLPEKNQLLYANDNQIKCFAGNMFFDRKSRYCEGTSNKINFLSGQWIKAGQDANWHIIDKYHMEQTSNTNYPALLVSPFNLGEGGTFGGDLKVYDTGWIDNDWIGLVFGYQNSNNYYYIGWTKNADSWHPYAGFVFGQIKNGHKIILSTAAENVGGWERGVTANLKIKYGPTYMKLYKDGKLVLNYKNNNFKPKGGKVGFYNWSQKDVYFSNFIASSYPKCPTGYSYNENNGQCVLIKVIPSQYIESTCRMYGHVGGIWVKNGITSAVVDKDALVNPLNALYSKNNIKDYKTNYYDPAQRIDFWGSYNKEYYLGFIEFLKDIKPKDSKKGYKPKDPRVFDIASNGFSAYSPIGSYTYYVSLNKEGSGDMSQQKCQEVADKFNLKIVTEKNANGEFLNISKFLTGNEIEGNTEDPVCKFGIYDANSKNCINIPDGKPNIKYCLYGKLYKNTTCIVKPRCVLEDTSNLDDINGADYAYRIIYSNKKEVFKCSQWNCKDHQCAKAVCESGYLGTLHNNYENIDNTKCDKQTCDAMGKTYEFCGKKMGCPKGNGYQQINNKCYSLSCPTGMDFDPISKKCITYQCPPNSKLSKDGNYCVKKKSF